MLLRVAWVISISDQNLLVAWDLQRKPLLARWNRDDTWMRPGGYILSFIAVLRIHFPQYNIDLQLNEKSISCSNSNYKRCLII